MTTLVFADNAYGTIGSGLIASDTTLAFTSGHGARFPAVAAGQALYCCILNANNVLEEVIITLHVAGSDSATMTRAAGSTTAKVWSSGDRIEARLSSSILNSLAQLSGSTFTDFTVGTATVTGRIMMSTAAPVNYGLATIVSSASPDIWSAANTISYTGASTATGFQVAPQAGVSRTLIPTGAAVFATSANLIIQGTATSYTAAAGDVLDVYAITTAQHRMTIKKADGTPVSGASSANAYAIINDTKSSGVSGGTFTNGAWQTRDLNTEVYDASNIVTISSNQFTLAAGTYIIEWSAPGSQVDRHASRLFNITDTAVTQPGGVSVAPATSGQNASIGAWAGTISGTKVFEIQHQCQTTRSSEGFGNAAGTSFTVTNEIYTQVKITKVS